MQTEAGRLTAYRRIAYFCTLLSGMSGLIFQIAWQKYLSFLVGSEARSISLVVGVFLLGLAAGYHFWGNLTERVPERHRLLRLYGFAEAGIGCFALLFPWYFRVIKQIGYAAPDRFLIDVLLTLLLLLVPTFLMGATIPVLTKVLPEDAQAINATHARVYGVNTLGAFLGTWLAGFFLIHWLGLVGTLALGGMLNLAAAAVFIWNPLRGVHRVQTAAAVTGNPTTAPVPNPFGTRAIYLLAFVTGAVSISLEVLFVRLLGLSVGSSYYVFPVVLGVFVLALAVGSLSLGDKPASANRLLGSLAWTTTALALVFLTVGHWPNWLMLIRHRLGSTQEHFSLYLLGLALFMALMLFPILVGMGRALPLGFALLDKDAANYGKIAGRVYFINTAGTVAGSWVLGYLALEVMNLDEVYRICLVLLTGVTAYLFCRWRLGRGLAWKRSAAMGLVVVLAIGLIPRWARNSYFIGLFRSEDLKDRGFWHLTSLVRPGDVDFYKDGPDATVSVTRFMRSAEEGGARISRSLIVNAKSDGNTVGDYSTMALLASVPYLQLSKPAGLSVAVVGLGTGITAGLLSRFEDVHDVTVVEISPTVIEAGHFFDHDNEELRANPKATIVQADAFKFFSRSRARFDLIVSEPSNPWVTGVENLFTPEFYDLAQQSMAPDGVFVQWLHLYEISQTAVAVVFRNFGARFSYANAFLASETDLVLVGSNRPVRAPWLERRFHEPFVKASNLRIGLDEVDQLQLLSLFEADYLRHLGADRKGKPHDLEHPWLSYAANTARFARDAVDLDDFTATDDARHFQQNPEKAGALQRLYTKYPGGMPQCRDPFVGSAVVCQRYEKFRELLDRYRHSQDESGRQGLIAYGALRRHGCLQPDPGFLAAVRARASSEPPGQAKAQTDLLVTQEEELDRPRETKH